MDILALLNDYGVPYVTEGHKHARPGWVNTACPFHHTDHPGYHLGFTVDGKISYCWSCGVHFVDDSIQRLLNISRFEARKIISDYAGVSFISAPETKRKIQAKAHKLPSNISPLLPSHVKYLVQRKFDPFELKEEWNLVSTGPVSKLDHIDYSHRILAPIFWERREVTFQARDVTNKHQLKYLACPKDREIIHHKHLIYKHPNLNKSTCICCEGITDVWRFGPNAVATFGIEYTRQQVRLMARLFRRVAVCFDDEPQAVRQANELIADLRFRKVDAFRIDIVGDPGSMKQEDADYLIKQILK